MKYATIVFLVTAAFASAAVAQFNGPSASGPTVTVAASNDLHVGRYVTVVGRIVEHLREDYYTFRDATGEIRVEIEDSVWRGRPIGPSTRVRLQAEVDQSAVGRYLWVKSLSVIE